MLKRGWEGKAKMRNRLGLTDDNPPEYAQDEIERRSVREGERDVGAYVG